MCRIMPAVLAGAVGGPRACLWNREHGDLCGA